MERLTYRGRNGKGYVRNQGYYDKVYLNMAEVAERLTAYEDTGLEPEEVVALKDAEQKRREGCGDCKSGVYMTNNVQHPQYKWCPKCGRDLRGESHD